MNVSSWQEGLRRAGDDEVAERDAQTLALEALDVLLGSQEDLADYQADAEEFLHTVLENKAGEGHRSALPCDLPRASREQANRTWEMLMAEFASAPTGGEAWDNNPWVRPMHADATPSPLERARYWFPARLFDGSAGVVEGLAKSWTGLTAWQEDALRKRLGERDFQLLHFNYPEYVHALTMQDAVQGMSLSAYLDRREGGRGAFLFLNEPDLLNRGISVSGRLNAEELETIEMLRKDFVPHPPFAATPEERHAILSLDGRGSSHGFHVHRPVWQTQVVGHKVWWLLPSDVPGDRAETGHSAKFLGGKGKQEAAFGAAPVVGGGAFRAPNACALLKRARPPPGTMRCVVGPGDTILLPDDTWHATCALDTHTGAVGGWLVNTREVP